MDFRIPGENGAGCYTGVGSRDTPEDIRQLMRAAATRLALLGWVLRSGGADGADSAFEEGVGVAAAIDDRVDIAASKQIFLPWRGFNANRSALYNIPPAVFEIAKAVHPNWVNLKPAVQKLHARNAQQVLGLGLTERSAFCICWTKDQAIDAKTCSSRTGGTGTAIKLCTVNDVPVLNIARQDHLLVVRSIVDIPLPAKGQDCQPRLLQP